MAEQIILDPSEVSSNRTALDITPWIRTEGIDWGNAEIQAYMAEQTRGEVPVDFRVPNREIQLPFRFSGTLGGTTTTTARANIQAKLSLFQQEGGWIKRVTNSGGTVYADVVSASFAATSVSGWESRQNADVDAEGMLECKPDFYGDEVTLSDHTETTNPELVFTETSISGDFPCRVRLVVDDDSGNNQQGLIWSFRARNYSSASTAATRYEAEALGLLGNASKVAISGASGGTLVQQGTLFPAWTPMLSTNVGGTQYLTHTGTNQLWARVRNAGTVPAEVRVQWDVGDLVNPITNTSFQVPAGTAFYQVPLGEARLDPSPVGTHRWQGQYQARGVGGTTTFGIDRIYVLNADEGYGRLTAPIVSGAADSTLVAYDSFEQTSGTALATQAAPLGGNWDPGAAGGSTAEDGDTDDFTTNGFYVLRNPGADSSLTNGRYEVLDGSSTIAAVQVQVDMTLPRITSSGKEVRGGVLARFVDTDNWLMAVRRNRKISFDGDTRISLYKRVAGTVTTLGDVLLSSSQQTAEYTIKLTVDAAGNVAVYTGTAGSNLGAALISVTADANLATGGALDDGKVGFYDASDLASAGTRTYDDFEALSAVSSSDAVVYASRSVQLTTDGHYRLDTGGTAYGPVSTPISDLPRLPVAGLEGRTTEIFVKASRGDFDQLPDSGIDDISARVYYRPSWLHVPNT